jgi:hypothetical protein
MAIFRVRQYPTNTESALPYGKIANYGQRSCPRLDAIGRFDAISGPIKTVWS